MTKNLEQQITKLENEISTIECGDPLYLEKQIELKKLKEQMLDENK